jgi:SAM-dependent methyltransferase
MPENIFDPRYWQHRLHEAIDREQVHHAIYQCDQEQWRRIADHHRQILAEVIKPSDKVLDVGCGWGRLLSLMPSDWTGAYIGVDLCPDFIATAARTHQDRRFHFVCGDIRWWDRSWGLNAVIKMDWAVLISIRPMVLRNAGELAWREIEAVLKLTCRSVLYLEYDEKAPGEVEHYT